MFHQTQSDSLRLTGNQVTSLTSLQMLSENRLVCQEAVHSTFKTELSSALVHCPELCVIFPLYSVQHILPSGRCARVVRGDRGSLSHTRQGGKKYVWLRHGRCDFSLCYSPGRVPNHTVPFSSQSLKQ